MVNNGFHKKVRLLWQGGLNQGVYSATAFLAYDFKISMKFEPEGSSLSFSMRMDD